MLGGSIIKPEEVGALYALIKGAGGKVMTEKGLDFGGLKFDSTRTYDVIAAIPTSLTSSAKSLKVIIKYITFYLVPHDYCTVVWKATRLLGWLGCVIGFRSSAIFGAHDQKRSPRILQISQDDGNRVNDPSCSTFYPEFDYIFMKIYTLQPKPWKTQNDEHTVMEDWGYWGDPNEIKLAISKGSIVEMKTIPANNLIPTLILIHIL